jgi:hypothetical protein
MDGGPGRWIATAGYRRDRDEARNRTIVTIEMETFF